MPKLNYDKKTGNVSIGRYSWDGYDATRYKPIYMLQCECGFPLKVYFKGRVPSKVRDLELESYSSTENYKLVFYTDQAWGIANQHNKCPACSKQIFIGPNLETAVTAAILKVFYTYDYGKKKLPKALITHILLCLDHSLVKKRLVVNKEAIAGRDDYVVIHKEEVDGWKPEGETYKEWEKRVENEMKKLRALLKLPEEITDAMLQEAADAKGIFDYGIEALASHDENCTCNLCMR